jgi:predicted nucleotidyltransferase
LQADIAFAADGGQQWKLHRQPTLAIASYVFNYFPGQSYTKAHYLSTTPPAGPGGASFDLSCPSAGDCWLSGPGPTGLLSTTDGGSHWSHQRSPLYLMASDPGSFTRVQAENRSNNQDMDEVADWLDQLPKELGAQRSILERLLDWCERQENVRWLTVGCSLERGNADRLSDIDVAIGVTEKHFEDSRGHVRHALNSFGDLVESYDYLLPLSFPVRRFFAQYRDRTQVDLTVGCAPMVSIPRSVVLYDPEGAVHIVGDEALDPKSEEVRIWACQAWEALANVGKYIRRSSFWESLEALHEARTHLFRLWALAQNVPQARYGITALIDSRATLPPGIDKSLPGNGLDGVLTAARYLAETLTELQELLRGNEQYELPDHFGVFVVADLAQANTEGAD